MCPAMSLTEETSNFSSSSWLSGRDAIWGSRLEVKELRASLGLSLDQKGRLLSLQTSLSATVHPNPSPAA